MNESEDSVTYPVSTDLWFLQQPRWREMGVGGFGLAIYNKKSIYFTPYFENLSLLVGMP